MRQSFITRVSVAPAQADVRTQLGRIVESETFSKSLRQCRFLRYIVEQSLQGKIDRLKGYTIGVDVFDKDEHFDPGADAIVRVEAGRLRAKLREYYQGAGAGDPLVIDLPKGTYAPRFLSARDARSAVQTTSAAKEHTVAVLPFRNLSGDPSQDVFGTGMTDAVITALAQTAHVKVISLTSVMRFRDTEKPIPEIAEELNVSHVLEGSVVKDCDRVRITGQLIEAKTDHHVWARSYERELSGVLILQREIAEDIAARLVQHIGRGGAAADVQTEGIRPEAYEAYLLGRRHRGNMTREGFRKAMSCFEKAIELEPGYANAYSAMASCYCVLGSYGFELEDPDTIIPEGLRYSRKAMELNPDLVESLTFTAIMTLKYKWDWDETERLFRRALDLNPSDARAHLQFSLYYETLCQHDAAIREAEAARQVDPLSREVVINLA